MSKKKENPSNEIEQELDEEERLEKLYGQETKTDRRDKKRRKEKYGPTGGTLAGQKHRLDTARQYSGDIKKIIKKPKIVGKTKK